MESTAVPAPMPTPKSDSNDVPVSSIRTLPGFTSPWMMPLVVGMAECAGDALYDRQHVLHVQPVAEVGIQVTATDVLHDNVGRIPSLPCVEDTDDVGMIKGAGHLPLGEKTRLSFLVTRNLG